MHLYLRCIQCVYYMSTEIGFLVELFKLFSSILLFLLLLQRIYTLLHFSGEQRNVVLLLNSKFLLNP